MTTNDVVQVDRDIWEAALFVEITGSTGEAVEEARRKLAEHLLDFDIEDVMITVHSAPVRARQSESDDT